MVKTALLFVALFAGAGPGSSGSPGGKTEFERAVRYYKAEEFQAALPLFEKAYDLSKHRASAILGLAQCERALKLYDRALKHFKEFLATNPKPADAASVRKTIELIQDLATDTPPPEENPPAKSEPESQTPPLEAQKTGEPAKPAETQKPAQEPKPALEPRGASPEAGSGPGRMYGGAQDVRREPANVAPVEHKELVPPERPKEEEQSTIFSSPIFWTAAVGVAAILAGGIAFGLSQSKTEAPYAGTTGLYFKP